MIWRMPDVKLPFRLHHHPILLLLDLEERRGHPYACIDRKVIQTLHHYLEAMHMKNHSVLPKIIVLPIIEVDHPNPTLPNISYVLPL